MSLWHFPPSTRQEGGKKDDYWKVPAVTQAWWAVRQLMKYVHICHFVIGLNSGHLQKRRPNWLNKSRLRHESNMWAKSSKYLRWLQTRLSSSACTMAYVTSLHSKTQVMEELSDRQKPYVHPSIPYSIFHLQTKLRSTEKWQILGCEDLSLSHFLQYWVWLHNHILRWSS